MHVSRASDTKAAAARITHEHRGPERWDNRKGGIARINTRRAEHANKAAAKMQRRRLVSDDRA